MATLSIGNALDYLAGREETSVSINLAARKLGAVPQLVTPSPMSSGILSYSTLTDVEFSTWDNSSTKTAQSLAGSVGEVQAKTIYAIVTYPKNYEADMSVFPQQFATAVANGLANAIDNAVLNGATGVIALASGVANTYPHTTVSPTTYQLRTDLVNTMALVAADGYRVNGIISEIGEVGNILNSVGSNGLPVFNLDDSGNVDRLLGQRHYSTFVNMDNGAEYVVGDWSKVVWGVREQLMFEKFTSGIVTISGVDHNLIQENLIAVRVETRMAFAVTQAAAFAYLY